MSNWEWTPMVQQPVPYKAEDEPKYEEDVEDQFYCSYCGEIFKLGERFVWRERGIAGIGPRSGRLTMVEDTYDPEEPVRLHEDCEEALIVERMKARGEEEELLKFCAGCGVKLSGD